MPEPVIDMQNVDFAYNHEPVLEDVTFEIQTRDFASVIGPNGGGKTTLLKLLLGLLAPDRGTVRVFGQRPRLALDRIGYVPQSYVYDPLFPIRVIDVVLMGRLDKTRLIGPWTRDDRLAAEDALAETHLADLARRPVASLSGGQRQRMLIARALACRPDLLLLDEPTSNLDPAAEEDLFEILNGINETRTILLVSHDVGFVSGYVNKTICVNRKVNVHPTSELTGELIQEVYGSHIHMVRHEDQLHDAAHSHPSATATENKPHD